VILLVETNFVLELAFLQEEHAHCEELLRMAERGELDLAVPAFSVAEAYQKQVGQQKERKRLHDSVLSEIDQLVRSRPYAERSTELREITRLLVASGEEERRNLRSVVDRILRVATIVPLTAAVVREAAILENTRGLSPQDALVYSSALAHLRGSSDRGPHLFVTRNPADFGDPDIASDLERLGSRILFRFADGLGYVQSQP
jgi:predicted nucleic acid-binding protein